MRPWDELDASDAGLRRAAVTHEMLPGSWLLHGSNRRATCYQVRRWVRTVDTLECGRSAMFRCFTLRRFAPLLVGSNQLPTSNQQARGHIATYSRLTRDAIALRSQRDRDKEAIRLRPCSSLDATALRSGCVKQARRWLAGCAMAATRPAVATW